MVRWLHFHLILHWHLFTEYQNSAMIFQECGMGMWQLNIQFLQTCQISSKTISESHCPTRSNPKDIKKLKGLIEPLEVSLYFIVEEGWAQKILLAQHYWMWRGVRLIFLPVSYTFIQNPRCIATGLCLVLQFPSAHYTVLFLICILVFQVLS